MTDDASELPLLSANTNHLIVVCCHAIWLGGPTHGATESEWLIESFQKGETPTFVQHVKLGLTLLDKAPEALLVFSGGPTKPDQTSLSEGQSYLNLAHDLLHLAPHPNLNRRTTAETLSTDSYQNILFSTLHFKSCVGRYPELITIVTHAFKKKRFVELHCPALRWPVQCVTAVGVDPPEHVTPQSSLLQAELTRGYGLWKDDLYGTRHPLSTKRAARGWKQDEGPKELERRYLSSADNAEDLEMAELIGCLLKWSGGPEGKSGFPGRLPWDGGREGLCSQRLKELCTLAERTLEAAQGLYGSESEAV